MGASGGRTPAVCIARAWLEYADCGLASAEFGVGESPIPSFPQRREGAIRTQKQGSFGTPSGCSLKTIRLKPKQYVRKLLLF